MRIVKRYVWVIVLTAFLAVVALVPLVLGDNRDVPFNIAVKQDGKEEIIKAWYDAEAGINYFFLPPYSDSDNTIIRVNSKDSLSYAGKRLNDGDYVSSFFDYEGIFEVSDNNSFNSDYKVAFVKAENVSTVYVTTATGSMREVFKDKKHKEPVNISIYEPNGTSSLADYSATINGRGNNTWKSDKKAFTLKFDKELSILGMQGSSKWILLANVRDQSNIKNKMIYDLAIEEGLSYTPESKFVMLYLNGEFYGLHLLCQSVNTANERIDGDSSSFRMATFHFPERMKYSTTKMYVGDREIPVEQVLPKNGKEEQREEIYNKINNIEKVLVADSGNQAKLSELIDIDSWSKKYLIDEIFVNYDAGIESSYFYWFDNGDNEKIFAGPIWDYDNTLGNMYIGTKNPQAIFAAHEYRGPGCKRYWYPELINNKEFYKYIVDLYNNEFSDKLSYLMDYYIPSISDEISYAVKCDEIRWNYDSRLFTENMVNYLKERKEFLDSYWTGGDKYCSVKIYVEGDLDYRYEYVPLGKTIYDCSFVYSALNDNQYVAYEEDSGAEFNLSQNIFENKSIILKRENTSIKDIINREIGEKKSWLVLSTFILIIVLSAVFFIKERINEADKNEYDQR